MELKRNPLSTAEMAFENARRNFERGNRNQPHQPHQGKREMERRAKQMAKKAAKEKQS